MPSERLAAEHGRSIMVEVLTRLMTLQDYLKFQQRYATMNWATGNYTCCLGPLR